LDTISGHISRRGEAAGATGPFLTQNSINVNRKNSRIALLHGPAFSHKQI
jgi:hypothetical protein